MDGWVKFHRKIEDWEWYTDANTFRVFFHLVLKANHKDKKWQGIEIKRGQLVTSPDSIALDLKLTRQKVRTSLSKLNGSEITIKSTNKYTLVTIENYELYQTKEEELTTKSTNKQPTNNQQITTNKNEKNDKKENKNIYLADIVGYLNEKTGKDFKCSTEKTIACLNARWNDGFINLQDYKTVIDNKCKEWLKPRKDEKDMSKYLRPETLFGNKFESYLNESPRRQDAKPKEPVAMVRREII